MTTNHILICGGGNGAQSLAAMISSYQQTLVNVFVQSADLSARWNTALEGRPMTLSIATRNGENEVRKGRPYLVTSDPAKAVEKVGMIFFVVPAFAHESYFTALKPYITDHTLLVGLPGQAGFEFQCRSILGHSTKKCAIVCFDSLPFIARIEEYGKEVHILGIKDTLGGCILVGSQSHLPFDPVDAVQRVFGDIPKIELIQNYVSVTLMGRSIVHPPIMYGKWKDYDGTPIDQKPLFYQGVNQEQADLLSAVSDEVVETARVIQEKRQVDTSMVKHLYEGFQDSYSEQIEDASTLLTIMRTTKALDGLVYPMKEIMDGKDKGKFFPDFSHRYLKEDVPFGIVVFKGIAEIAGVTTPTLDKIITWAQGVWGKEYIVGSELKGKDVGSTRAPQAYNIQTLDDLINFRL